MILWLRVCRCCCSVTKSCPTLCDPMDCSTPGFPVLHCLPEFAQTHVHLVNDAIQPPHPLSPPSPPALSLSQHQGLFQWVDSSHQVAKVLALQLQHQSFQWIFRLILFRIDCLDFLAAQRVFTSTTIGKHQSVTLLLYMDFCESDLSFSSLSSSSLSLYKFSFPEGGLLCSALIAKQQLPTNYLLMKVSAVPNLFIIASVPFSFGVIIFSL